MVSPVGCTTFPSGAREETTAYALNGCCPQPYCTPIHCQVYLYHYNSEPSHDEYDKRTNEICRADECPTEVGGSALFYMPPHTLDRCGTIKRFSWFFSFLYVVRLVKRQGIR